MKRKAYQKPTMTVVELQYRTCLLQTSDTTPSNTPPDNVPPYDGWLG
jgi:hypothetical protein